jgi:hypothetical protein
MCDSNLLQCRQHRPRCTQVQTRGSGAQRVRLQHTAPVHRGRHNVPPHTHTHTTRHTTLSSPPQSTRHPAQCQHAGTCTAMHATTFLCARQLACVSSASRGNSASSRHPCFTALLAPTWQPGAAPSGTTGHARTASSHTRCSLSDVQEGCAAISSCCQARGLHLDSHTHTLKGSAKPRQQTTHTHTHTRAHGPAAPHACNTVHADCLQAGRCCSITPGVLVRREPVGRGIGCCSARPACVVCTPVCKAPPSKQCASLPRPRTPCWPRADAAAHQTMQCCASSCAQAPAGQHSVYVCTTTLA